MDCLRFDCCFFFFFRLEYNCDSSEWKFVFQIMVATFSQNGRVGHTQRTIAQFIF